MSGLNQRFTKPPTGKTVREFESHILRQKVIGSQIPFYPQSYLLTALFMCYEVL